MSAASSIQITFLVSGELWGDISIRELSIGNRIITEAELSLVWLIGCSNCPHLSTTKIAQTSTNDFGQWLIGTSNARPKSRTSVFCNLRPGSPIDVRIAINLAPSAAYDVGVGSGFRDGSCRKHGESCENDIALTLGKCKTCMT